MFNNCWSTRSECLIKNDLLKLYETLNPNCVTMTFWQLQTLSKQALQPWSLVGVYTEAEFFGAEWMRRSWLHFSSTTANNKDNGHGKKSWLRLIASALKRQTQQQITRRVGSSHSEVAQLLSHLAVFVFEFWIVLKHGWISYFFLSLQRLTARLSLIRGLTVDPFESYFDAITHWIAFRCDQSPLGLLSMRSDPVTAFWHDHTWLPLVAVTVPPCVRWRSSQLRQRFHLCPSISTVVLAVGTSDFHC